MQFLVQYAHLVLPKTHVGATGNVVWDNICALQDELIQKRESAILVLAKALTALYPEQKPEVVRFMYAIHPADALFISTFFNHAAASVGKRVQQSPDREERALCYAERARQDGAAGGRLREGFSSGLRVGQRQRSAFTGKYYHDLIRVIL